MNSGSSCFLVFGVCLHSYTLGSRFVAATGTLRGAQLRLIRSDYRFSRLIQTGGSDYHFLSAQ